jgi:RNA polymerase primary sigma factor
MCLPVCRQDDRALGADDAAYVESLKHDLEGVLANLPAREAGVLRMRFGLVDGTEHTLDEIGLQFNVSAVAAPRVVGL